MGKALNIIKNKKEKKGYTSGVKVTKYVDDLLKDIDSVDEQVSALAEERKSLVSKLQSQEITLAEYDDLELAIRAKSMVIDPEGLGQKFDDAVGKEIFATRNRNAVRAYKTSMRLINSFVGHAAEQLTLEAASDGRIPAEIPDMTVKAADMITLYNAVGDIASSDAAAEQTFLDPMVAYIEQPLSYLNVVSKRSVTNQTIRDLQSDSTKEEGGFDEVAEGAALTQIDFGTKEVTRGLITSGAYMVVQQEWLSDTDRRHFLPYINARIIDKSRLRTEAQALKGTGTNNEATGVTIDGTILTGTAQAAGAFTRTHINEYATLMGLVWDGIKKMPSVAIIHPKDFVKALTTGSDQAGWYLAPPLGYAGGAPAGRSIPELFGMMVLPSFAVDEGEGYVMNLENIFLAINGGEYRREEGFVGSNLTKRQRTIVLYTFFNSFSRFPKAVAKWQGTL